MTGAELDAYFKRIGFDGATPPQPDTIERLQPLHRRAIPFENLDIRLGRGITLAPDAIFAKLVTGRRGGYCFEQNALFLRVLAALGFEARPLLGRVWLRPAPGEVPNRTHTLNLVTVAGRPFLSDVGFGGSIAPLLPLQEGTVVDGEGIRHSLERDATHGWMLRRDGAPQYSFTEETVWPADLDQANHFTATAPSSRFVRVVIASRPTAEGLVTLTDRRLSAPEGERLIETAEDWRSTLSARLGLELTPDEVRRLTLF